MINESEERIPPFQKLPVKLGNFVSGMTLVILHEGAHFGDEWFGRGNELRPGDFPLVVGIPQSEDGADALAWDAVR
jgi:hypothetical protein